MLNFRIHIIEKINQHLPYPPNSCTKPIPHLSFIALSGFQQRSEYDDGSSFIITQERLISFVWHLRAKLLV